MLCNCGAPVDGQLTEKHVLCGNCYGILRTIELKRIGDMEPSCPKCGNAMLLSHGYRWADSKDRYQCRDCGFAVLRNKVKITSSAGAR